MKDRMKILVKPRHAAVKLLLICLSSLLNLSDPSWGGGGGQ